MSTTSSQPAVIQLTNATRFFDLKADNGRTLKELFLRTGAKHSQRICALDDVSLTINKGERVAIIGRNGAGKTSTLRILAGIVPLTSGQLTVNGRVGALIDLAAGFSRDFSGRENLIMGGALHGLTQKQIESLLPSIIEFSELAEYVDLPIKSYSSGMLVRLAFSLVAHLRPDLLLIDEVLAVGDGAFQKKCVTAIEKQLKAGCTLVLVSHDLGLISSLCDRVILIEAGKVTIDGPATEVIQEYERLLSSGDSAPVRAT